MEFVKKGKQNFILISSFCFWAINLYAQQTTYCNPINIDYTYMIYNAHKNLSYRSGADPAVVRFKDEYYMFVTRSMGYWHSKDMDKWSFIRPKQWYFQGSNAPAAFNY
ncbi:MAG: family 43 glycosylhydrolase, partial [Aurantibacter sp.]